MGFLNMIDFDYIMAFLKSKRDTPIHEESKLKKILVRGEKNEK
jgi:hypothetical protein